MEHSMTYPPAQQPEPGPAVVLAPTKRRRWPWIVAAVLVIAAVGIGGVLLGRGGSKSSPGASPTFVLNGTLKLVGTATQSLSFNGTTCQGIGGYSDLTAGAAVIVQDPQGHTIATGSLGEGFSSVADQQTEDACWIPFTVSSIPEGPSSYSVTITHRGTQVVSATEAHGGLALTIGGN
jgi:hypothetical protein